MAAVAQAQCGNCLRWDEQRFDELIRLEEYRFGESRMIQLAEDNRAEKRQLERERTGAQREISRILADWEPWTPMPEDELMYWAREIVWYDREIFSVDLRIDLLEFSLLPHIRASIIQSEVNVAALDGLIATCPIDCSH